MKLRLGMLICLVSFFVSATFSQNSSDLAALGSAKNIIRPEQIRAHIRFLADSLLHSIDRARQRRPWVDLGLPERFGLVTLHRPANVDDPATLGLVTEALCAGGGGWGFHNPSPAPTSDRPESARRRELKISG